MKRNLNQKKTVNGILGVIGTAKNSPIIIQSNGVIRIKNYNNEKTKANKVVIYNDSN